MSSLSPRPYFINTESKGKQNQPLGTASERKRKYIHIYIHIYAAVLKIDILKTGRLQEWQARFWQAAGLVGKTDRLSGWWLAGLAGETGRLQEWRARLWQAAGLAGETDRLSGWWLAGLAGETGRLSG